PLHPESFLELLELSLLLFFRRRLLRLVLLLVSDDVRVGPVRRIKLDIDGRGWRNRAEARIDEELDDDDRGREQRQRGADPLLAAAVLQHRAQAATHHAAGAR